MQILKALLKISLKNCLSLSASLSLAYTIYFCLFLIAGGQLRGQAKLSVLLFVSSLIGIFSRIYILVLCDAFSFM